MIDQIVMLLWTCVAMGIVLLLPGSAWLAWFPLKNRDFANNLATAFGISLAVTALGALTTFLTGVYLNGIEVVFIYAVFAALTVVGLKRRRLVWHLSWDGSITIILIGLAIAWRLYQAISLALPAWVDALEHVLIVQAIINRGGLPADLSPFAPAPIYYHFGFHSVAAVYAFLSGLSATKAVMILGQVLNAGVGLVIYRLGYVIWQDARRGLAAALLVTFFTTMPGYYVTWSRYTLLVGLILMGLAMAEVIEIIHKGDDPKSEPTWRIAIRLGLLTGGVLISHYLAGILLALFLVVAGLYLAWRDANPLLAWHLRTILHGKPPSHTGSDEVSSGVEETPAAVRPRIVLWQGWLPLLAGSLGGALFTLPWILRVLHFSSSSIALDATLPTELGGKGFSTGYSSYLWYLAGPQHNYWLMLFGILGLLYVLLFRKRRLSLGEGFFAVWGALLGFGCLPIGLNLAPFHPHHLVMLIFFPIVLLASHLIISAGDALGKTVRHAWVGHLGAVLAVVLLCIWGVRETRSVINSVTVLADRADLEALDWINANVPEDGRFFINTTPWQGAIFRGVDGGYWIMPYTGRQSLLPPIVYSWGAKDYTDQINAWAVKASQIKTCDDSFWKLVADAHLTYIYLHEGQGLLHPEGLKDCPRLQVIYQKHGVWIYQVNP